MVPVQDALEFINVEDIIRCEGTNGYTTIFYKNKNSLLSSLSIGHFRKILNQSHFFMVHKSHLINTNYIIKYLNEGYVVLNNNDKVPVSKSRRQKFIGYIQAKCN